jgi:hypothetical protein
MDQVSLKPFIMEKDEIIARAVPWKLGTGGHQGVYFLTYRGHLVYVGKATQICLRLRRHALASEKKWDRCFWIEIDDEQVRRYVEAIYINEFWPVYNAKVEILPPWEKRKKRPDGDGLAMVVKPLTLGHKLAVYKGGKWIDTL